MASRRPSPAPDDDEVDDDDDADVSTAAKVIVARAAAASLGQMFHCLPTIALLSLIPSLPPPTFSLKATSASFSCVL